MKKRRKLKKKVVVLIVLVLLLIFMVIGFFLYKSFSTKTSDKAKVVDKIPEYGYYLEDDQPKIYKDLFNELVKVLKNKNVDEEKYASLISRMAAIDFYNLDNKVSKNDVGAVQFIYENSKNNFILEASETVYKYIELDTTNNRKQELPIVSSSQIKSIKKDKYKYKKIDDDNSYVVEVLLEYKKDLGYPKSVTLKLLHNNNKLEIYEMK